MFTRTNFRVPSEVVGAPCTRVPGIPRASRSMYGGLMRYLKPTVGITGVPVLHNIRPRDAAEICLMGEHIPGRNCQNYLLAS